MAYATAEELAPLIGKTGTVTQLEVEAMQRVLDVAAAEIDWELGWDPVDNPPPDPAPPLVKGVNLERALEHWKAERSPYGTVVLGAEGQPIIASRNTWYRHHLTLLPLKAGDQWGIA